MIDYLNGLLVEKHPMRVVIDVGGIGYEVLIPLSSYDRLPQPNQPCRLLTYEYIREDQRTLYGFHTEAERGMFVMLMSVNGVGPKIALSALSGMSLVELAAAVAGGDVQRLSSVSGVGRKKAERIVLELREKIGEGGIAAAASVPDAVVSPADVKLRDAVLALVSLGYKQNEARALVKKAVEHGGETASSVEDVIRRALANA